MWPIELVASARQKGVLGVVRWCRRTLPVSTLGSGATTTGDKLQRLLKAPFVFPTYDRPPPPHFYVRNPAWRLATLSNSSGRCAMSCVISRRRIPRVLMLECGPDLLFKRLATISGWLADQGTELKLGDAPSLSPSATAIVNLFAKGQPGFDTPDAHQACCFFRIRSRSQITFAWCATRLRRR